MEAESACRECAQAEPRRTRQNAAGHLPRLTWQMAGVRKIKRGRLPAVSFEDLSAGL